MNDQLSLPAELTNLPQFIAFATDRAQQEGFSSRRIHEVELVIEEALVNVMTYAYPDQPGMLTLMAKTTAPAILTFEISDQGEIFNPLDRSMPDVESELMERPIGGLGILLMKELADELSWQRHGDENRLTITFAKHHVQ